MKILIMVLSNKKAPYDMLEKAQRETWDSISVDGVETYYYHGKAYNMMHYEFKLALKRVWKKGWDVILRVNSSAYVDKLRLVEYLKGREAKGLMIGNNEGILSGAGFIISRDLAKIVMDNLDKSPNGSEDTLIESILNRHGYFTECGDRVQYNHVTHKVRLGYNYRCKSETGYRNDDVIAFNKLFNGECHELSAN